ncbi:guanine nucleotide-binding protein subunit alpha [Clydaea vesicula]|uniref:Guanine nucleotide-binding protein subunit alpha n=1 Tax=Clydaea vesicula TaxID=447962 RepID=A0AAD5XZI8_9FUNG|nr:guanine nucleotide-binding protein subunit alpha [Clydaea vesicula]
MKNKSKSDISMDPTAARTAANSLFPLDTSLNSDVLENSLTTYEKPPKTPKQKKKISKLIDSQIQQELNAQNQPLHTRKLLLLGSGDSGKSTLLKQMKILHGNGFDAKERITYRIALHKNVVDSMKALISAADTCGISISSQNLKNKAAIEDFNFDNNLELESFIWDAIDALWKDVSIQECYKRSNEFNIQDTANYFFRNVNQYRKTDYLCTDEGNVILSK